LSQTARSYLQVIDIFVMYVCSELLGMEHSGFELVSNLSIPTCMKLRNWYRKIVNQLTVSFELSREANVQRTSKSGSRKLFSSIHEARLILTNGVRSRTFSKPFRSLLVLKSRRSSKAFLIYLNKIEEYFDFHVL